MDFIALATLVGVVITMLMFSYDVICQWSRNFKKRIGQFPSWMQLSPVVLDTVKYVIPKLHIHGHGSRCQTTFSLNFLRYSARTNGEEPERWWAHINPVSMSTKEMGAGARHDTIDDHAAAWNWRKITNFGILILVILNLMLIAIYYRKIIVNPASASIPDESQEGGCSCSLYGRICS
jgi:Kyakuja-Dileera-Zisupton transposase